MDVRRRRSSRPELRWRQGTGIGCPCGGEDHAPTWRAFSAAVEERDLPLLVRWMNDPEVRHWLHHSERPDATVETVRVRFGLERGFAEPRLDDRDSSKDARSVTSACSASTRTPARRARDLDRRERRAGAAATAPTRSAPSSATPSRPRLAADRPAHRRRQRARHPLLREVRLRPRRRHARAAAALREAAGYGGDGGAEGRVGEVRGREVRSKRCEVRNERYEVRGTK